LGRQKKDAVLADEVRALVFWRMPKKKDSSPHSSPRCRMEITVSPPFTTSQGLTLVHVRAHFEQLQDTLMS
jgi:hypothetical protein